MSLYAIGDFHLSFENDKPMDIFGDKWKNHSEKLKTGFSEVTDADTVVICGDLSWSLDLEGATNDFRFISELPGQKIILKGNHDYWWSTAAKLNRFFEENGISNIRILNNNCFFYEDYAICGTRGWFYEEEKDTAHDKKIMLRELGRLETSLKAAGDKEKLVFLHYPPVFGQYSCDEILQLFNSYNVKLCCYGHLHGKSCGPAFKGSIGAASFKLVSADYLDFKPLRII